MTKQEFLDQLGRALASRVGGSSVSENLSYYEEYIATQVRAGRSEEEVIAELGDPRLLARSISEAQKRAGTENDDNTVVDETQNTSVRRVKMPGWLILILIVLIVFLLIGAVFSILGALLPFLIPVAIVIFFLRVIQSK